MFDELIDLADRSRATRHRVIQETIDLEKRLDESLKQSVDFGDIRQAVARLRSHSKGHLVPSDPPRALTTQALHAESRSHDGTAVYECQ